MTSIFGDTFSRGWAPGELDDRAWLDAFVEVETELLRAAATVGAVSQDAVAIIEQRWGASDLTVDQVGTGASAGGNPVIPLVSALRAAVPEQLRGFVHFGATSQDVLDSAAMLIARRALAVIDTRLTAAADAAGVLAAQHVRTEIAGRTLLQSALPTTFGLKAAGWLTGLAGAASRLGVIAAALPVQYGGPVGTFSGSDGCGPAIRAELARRLGLVDTILPWHTVRLPIADLAGGLATAAGVAGKVALDIVLLAQTEIAEVTEGQPDATQPRGGSSSLPHKHNPVAAISARACALRTPALAGTLFGAMAQEHERAAGAWHSEWETLTDLLRLTGSAAAWLADSLEHLQVDVDRMQLHRAQMVGNPAAAADLTESALRAAAHRLPPE